MVTRGARAAGFTYLTVLFMVAILAGGLALIGEVWHTSAAREKEAELLFVGHQYRKAIERYYLFGPQRQYPRELEHLLKDPRRPGTERYLRRLYPDPVSGGAFALVKAPDGGILGVHSPSEEQPFKTGGFKVRDAAFEGKAKYSEWQFVHTAPPLPAGAKPGAPKPGAAQAESAPPQLPKGSH
jgi:type II secretory pathway pseudopilin PulG